MASSCHLNPLLKLRSYLFESQIAASANMSTIAISTISQLRTNICYHRLISFQLIRPSQAIYLVSSNIRIPLYKDQKKRWVENSFLYLIQLFQILSYIVWPIKHFIKLSRVHQQDPSWKARYFYYYLSEWHSYPY